MHSEKRAEGIRQLEQDRDESLDFLSSLVFGSGRESTKIGSSEDTKSKNLEELEPHAKSKATFSTPLKGKGSPKKKIKTKRFG